MVHTFNLRRSRPELWYQPGLQSELLDRVTQRSHVSILPKCNLVYVRHQLPCTYIVTMYFLSVTSSYPLSVPWTRIASFLFI